MAEEPFTLHIVSDVMCPWCYIGKRRFERAMTMVDAGDIDIRWRPFQLDATIPEKGMDRQEYLARKFGSAERAEEVYAPIRAAGEEEGIPFAFERITVAPNTLNAHRLIRWAHPAGVQDAMVERLFKLYFIEGGDLSDIDVLADAAGEVGLEREVAARLLAGDVDIEETRQEIAAAQHIGITGVPTFLIDSRYAVIGAQQGETIAAAITQRLKEREQEGAAAASTSNAPAR